MSLENSCLKEFDAVTRARGEDLFHSGTVHIKRLANNAAEFQVHLTSDPESELHLVRFDWSQAKQQGAIRVHCTCGSVEKSEFCQHIWASVLAADQSEHIEITVSQSRLSLSPLAQGEVTELFRNSIDVQESLQWPIEKIQPMARAKIQKLTGSESEFTLQPVITYDGIEADIRSAEKVLLDPNKKIRIKRISKAEKSYLKALKNNFSVKGMKPVPLKKSDLASIIQSLTESNWRLELEGSRIVTLSGVEGVLGEHHGQFAFVAVFDFNGEKVSLRSVIKACSEGEKLIRLSNGSIGLLPDDWARRIDLLRRGSKISKEGYLLLGRSSMPLFKPVFDGFSGLKMDVASKSVYSGLDRLAETGQAEKPVGLKANLRAYQSEGLFWLEKIAASGFGGILADDMGLGKTIQVISYLLLRSSTQRNSSLETKPSLVVLPKSLVFNWLAEIEKFGPRLRVLDFAGATRGMLRATEYDVVVTTYHVLKNEIDRFEKIDFDTIILDEAQAIKNPSSQVAQAVYRLKGDHRFALSGTPIENSLGDLFSLMRFTNPGLIPSSIVTSIGDGRKGEITKDSLERLSTAVSPFILRRTKKQVLTELPDKCEQTLFCELEGAQKKMYDQLRKHFKASLKKSLSENTHGKSKMQVFEALLRLRQASCHPGLIEEQQKTHSSAKFDVLLEHLREIRKAGNKALVFSQFTSLLELLKPHLKRAKIKFEYLDGQTRNRGAVVDRFNGDEKTTVFLISLKAGGTGLNLTTASYVFLLDPWWNPAIEAQAIDRAYRMGQKQKVMAYRLIAEGTIEEKIMRMQALKRSLADAVISEDQSFLRTLSVDDLASLFD